VVRLAIAGLRHPHIDTIIAEARVRDDVTLVGIAEPDAPIRADYAERLGVPAVEDFHELLDKADVVGIGAINSERAGIACAALDAGLHVIADKPLATTLSDVDAVEAAWRRSGRVLSVAFEKRFYPPTLAAEEIMHELGDLTIVAASAPHKLSRERRPGWMFRHRMYGGILNDLAVHDLDLFLHFTGAGKGIVNAAAGNRANADRPEFQDYGVATVQTDDGPVGTFEVHWMSPEAADYHGDYRMRLVGTDGTAELLWKDGRLEVGTHKRPPRVVPMPAGLRPAEDFFDALVVGRPPAISPNAALAATRLALWTQESADNHTTISWNIERHTG
jgi:predicted dehydrogenase